MITNGIGGDILIGVFAHYIKCYSCAICHLQHPEKSSKGRKEHQDTDVFSYWGNIYKHHQQSEILRFTTADCNKFHIENYIAN